MNNPNIVQLLENRDYRKEERVHNNNSDGKSKYNFSGFVQVLNSPRPICETVRVNNSGSIYLNTYTQKHFHVRSVELWLKEDGQELILIPKAASHIHIRKNGCIDKTDILDVLKSKEIVLPISYIGEWDEEEQLWHGVLKN